ncbi:hypothetical protein AB3N59_13460 [Leptospira sp. WS92.C1]
MKLLERAVERFGGWNLWKRLDSLEFYFDRLGASIPVLKGLGKTFQKHGHVKVFPKKFTAEFLDYPSRDKKIIFQNGKVGIFNINESEVAYEISDYRKTFQGFRKFRRWNPLDVSYFFGYAITQYLSVPFLLKEYGVREVELAEGFRIDAEFPPFLHTHCRKQSYYFDKEGLLIRNDYIADILAPWAAGAHFTTDYQNVDGLPVATKRNVYFRFGTLVTPIPVLSAELKPLRVNFH